MNGKVFRIGTRDSQLALWQANKVKDLLEDHGYKSELVYIKSEGDLDLKTPLYEIGVTGIFTRSLDIALLNDRIDVAVHSMKDVPTQLPKGIVQSAVLKRASHKDLLVFKDKSILYDWQLGELNLHYTIEAPGTIATSSIRRKAQWLNRYPHHTVENLRGNVNTRLRKVDESNWDGAIFAAAGLERINIRPENSIELEWMLPAPSQGAIVVVCREEDTVAQNACELFNDADTALCTQLEKQFLRTLKGGCSTPVGALATIEEDMVIFKGNIFTNDGTQRVDIEKRSDINEASELGNIAAVELLANGGKAIAESIHHDR